METGTRKQEVGIEASPQIQAQSEAIGRNSKTDGYYYQFSLLDRNKKGMAETARGLGW